MKVKCCKCQKEYSLEDNIFEYKKDTNCPILICPYCGFKHAINFMPFENKIENLKKVEKIELGLAYPLLGASRIANASRVDRSGKDDGDVIQGTPWDISTFRVGAESYLISETPSHEVFFKPDGLKMYVLGYGSKRINQYTLSTAWKLSTATYDDKNFFIADEELAPFGLFFKPDGTEMYITGMINKLVFQYTLSTAWDVSSASYTSSFSVTNQVAAPSGVSFKSDGLKMYVSCASAGSAGVYQYSLTKAWDVTSASYETKKLDTISETTSPYTAVFKPDGLKLYVMGFGNDTIFQYTLSTAWDVSTATYDNKSYVVTAQETNPYGLFVKSDGLEFFILGSGSNKVWQYVMKTAWTKTDDFILATRIYGSKGAYNFAYKLKWRNVTDGGVFADVGATGEISFSADTVLVNGQALPIGSKICDEQGSGAKAIFTWQDGLESEGDNILPDSGTYSLADEYYTELQWALSCDDAHDEDEYEFALFELTNGTSIGTCLTSITMAAAAGVTHALISTAVIAVSTTSALSRGITEALLSTANIASSITGSLSRGIKEYLTSTSNIVTSTTSSLSRGVKEALASTSNIATSITAVLSRGIIETLNSTSAITISITSALSRGIIEALTSISVITTSITAFLNRGIKAVLTSTVNITTSTISTLNRGIKEVLVSTADIVVSIISRLSEFIKFLRAILSVDINDSILSINIGGSILSIEVNGSVLLISYNESEFSIYDDDSEVSIYGNESILTIIE